MACRRCEVFFFVFTVAHGLQVRDSITHVSNEPGMNVAQMMCSGYQAPDVAVCLAGTARSFPHPLVLQSVKDNLLGGSFGAQMTPFLHVARRDARGDAYSGGPDVFPDWSEGEINQAASYLGIAGEDIRIFDGPDMPVPDNCTEYESGYEYRRSCEARNDCAHTATFSYLKALAGTLSHRKGCMDLISAKESTKGHLFDVIILARADLTYYFPVRPYCLYDLDTVEGDNLRGRSYWDWFFMLPRNESERMFVDPYNKFYGCEEPLGVGLPVERYLRTRAGTVAVDPSLPVIVTRKPGSEHSLCFELKRRNAALDPRLCPSLIDGNEFNSHS